jgi:hypothetical protein
MRGRRSGRIRSPGPLYEFPLERPLGVLSTPFRCHHDYFHPFLSRCRRNHSRSDALKMKAKACTRCRQSKLRCDSDAKSPDACTRCRSINKPCIVDRSFQCTSKKRRLLELESEVKRLREAAVMVGQVAINPPRSIEVVQVLLVLCMWPFPFYSTLGDPSFPYFGLATQIGLQIGLHRPSLSQEFSSKKQVLDVREDVRKTTWMACYVVNQMQVGRLGVPLSISADYPFQRKVCDGIYGRSV